MRWVVVWSLLSTCLLADLPDIVISNSELLVTFHNSMPSFTITQPNNTFYADLTYSDFYEKDWTGELQRYSLPDEMQVTHTVNKSANSTVETVIFTGMLKNNATVMMTNILIWNANGTNVTHGNETKTLGEYSFQHELSVFHWNFKSPTSWLYVDLGLDARVDALSVGRAYENGNLVRLRIPCCLNSYDLYAYIFQYCMDDNSTYNTYWSGVSVGGYNPLNAVLELAFPQFNNSMVYPIVFDLGPHVDTINWLAIIIGVVVGLVILILLIITWKCVARYYAKQLNEEEKQPLTKQPQKTINDGGKKKWAPIPKDVRDVITHNTWQTDRKNSEI